MEVGTYGGEEEEGIESGRDSKEPVEKLSESGPLTG